jgi:hypothetical protein
MGVTGWKFIAWTTIGLELSDGRAVVRGYCWEIIGWELLDRSSLHGRYLMEVHWVEVHCMASHWIGVT